ncbi:hypothetical protein C5N14_14615 [Micromonospora sp. MW-13]|uniref:hypothetical protein n=1 Tax=Micromonospora sp. MW-13 TaxID=2094022 RepID=UPI000E434061|nr:hypothetical protein [Micromonospora sp. MW-13]RGC68148.1 hypothetical protein C5N14_14615 [Micromonospora sp. MW-13]
MQDWERRIAGIDWGDAERVHPEASAVLTELAAGGALAELLEQVPDRPDLAARCEHLRSLDKLVLFDDPASGVRLRLHLFKDRYLDLPHNHRWTFTSLMLRGGYTQYLYGPWHDEVAPPPDLKPTCVQVVQPGEIYTLDHTVVHSLAADSSAVTVILRGPVMKERAVWFDRTTSESWLHEGGAGDTRMQPMTGPEVEDVVRQALAVVRGASGRAPAEARA